MTACRRQVFLVEDDAGIRDAVRSILEDEGYDVTEARNGAEALAGLRAHEGTPCLILLDLMMPVMDGWAFRAEQGQDPVLSSIPVVVMTADGHAVQKAERMKANGALQKPIALTTLLDTVERWCGAA